MSWSCVVARVVTPTEHAAQMCTPLEHELDEAPGRLPRPHPGVDEHRRLQRRRKAAPPPFRSSIQKNT
jgi:hypothetical protein